MLLRRAYLSTEAGEIIPLIWKDLYERYKELTEVGEWFAHKPRLTVVGRSDSRPGEFFAELFGAAAATETHSDEDGSEWEVHANFTLDEVPGGGLIGAAGEDELALCYLRESDLTVFCLLAGRMPDNVELALYEHVRRARTKQVVMVNQLLDPGERPAPRSPRGDRSEWLAWEAELKRVLNDDSVKFFPIHKLAGSDLAKLCRAIHDLLEAKQRLMYVAGVVHRPSREALVQKMILDLSRAAAFLGLNPIPYSDTIAITPVQVLLVCRVAGAYGTRISPGWATEFIATCGVVLAAGQGFRAIFRKLAKGVGEALPLRMALGAMVAFGGTELIGQAAHWWFQNDGDGTAREAAEAALAALTGLIRRG